MSEEYYAKVGRNPQFWLVANGERTPMFSMDEVLAHGLKPVRKVTAAELEAIPIAGQKKRGKRDERTGSDADAGDDAGDIPLAK